jgi:hypothetical protein
MFTMGTGQKFAQLQGGSGFNCSRLLLIELFAFYLPGSELCDRSPELPESQEGNIDFREFANPKGSFLVTPSAR